MYLGDGHITHARTTYRLMIYLNRNTPAIIARCATSIAVVVPERRVGFVRRGNCIRVSSYFGGWPQLLPQHGPSKKDERPIVLEAWQRGLVRAYPGAIRSRLHRIRRMPTPPGRCRKELSGIFIQEPARRHSRLVLVGVRSHRSKPAAGKCRNTVDRSAARRRAARRADGIYEQRADARASPRGRTSAGERRGGSWRCRPSRGRRPPAIVVTATSARGRHARSAWPARGPRSRVRSDAAR
jgi:hypothetical protein